MKFYFTMILILVILLSLCILVSKDVLHLIKRKRWRKKETLLWEAINTLIPILFRLDDGKMIWFSRGKSITDEMLEDLKERVVFRTIGKEP